MQTTSPIRRYVIIRRRDHAGASRWSIERIAPSPREAQTPPPAASRPTPPGARGA